MGSTRKPGCRFGYRSSSMTRNCLISSRSLILISGWAKVRLSLPNEPENAMRRMAHEKSRLRREGHHTSEKPWSWRPTGGPPSREYPMPTLLTAVEFGSWENEHFNHSRAQPNTSYPKPISPRVLLVTGSMCGILLPRVAIHSSLNGRYSAGHNQTCRPYGKGLNIEGNRLKSGSPLTFVIAGNRSTVRTSNCASFL